MLNNVQPQVNRTRGQMLISMPHLADPRFYHTTLAMFKHDDEGAAGVVFNKPARTIILSDLFGDMGISLMPGMEETPVYYGGPVNSNQVYVIHSHEYLDHDTIPICSGVSITTNRHVLTAIANKTGPKNYKICLGCAVWGPRQLESEISGAWQHNELSSWLYHELKPNDVFSTVNIWPVSVERYSKGIANNILNQMEKKHAGTNKTQ